MRNHDILCLFLQDHIPFHLHGRQYEHEQPVRRCLRQHAGFRLPGIPCLFHAMGCTGKVGTQTLHDGLYVWHSVVLHNIVCARIL